MYFFLYLVTLCWNVCIWKKTLPVFMDCLHRVKDFHEWDFEGLSNLFCGYIFSALLCLNSQRFASSFYQVFVISSSFWYQSVVLQFLCKCFKPPTSLLLLAATRHLEYEWSCQHSWAEKSETTHQAAPWKARIFDTYSNFFSPHSEDERWSFLLFVQYWGGGEGYGEWVSQIIILSLM